MTVHPSYLLLAVTRLVLGLMFAIGLVSCGSSSPAPPVVNTVNEAVAGYYTGTASVKMSDNTTALPIDDLRVFVNGSRIMAMGLTDDPANFVLYDIAISAIDGNSYTAVATIYKAAENIGSANVTGTINEGTSIEGNFAGNGIANGSFTVAYDNVVNAKSASLSVIGGGGIRYGGDLNTGGSDIRFEFNADGSLLSTKVSIDAIKMSGCNLITGSSLAVVASQNLYNVEFVLGGCDDGTVDGSYTGLATIFDDVTVTDGLMPIAFSNGSFAGTAIFERL